jgi:hypothetical protein
LQVSHRGDGELGTGAGTKVRQFNRRKGCETPGA